MHRKLDVFANVTILVVALLIGFSLIRQQINHPKEKTALAAASVTGDDLTPGKYLPPPAGYQWTDHDRTLMVALRYGCIHCEHNMQFYRQVQDKVKRSDAKASLISVFPDDSFVAQHDLDLHSLSGMPFIANIDLAKLHVPGTPTLLLVNSKGTILQSWVGELSQREQDEVMKSIQ